MRFDSISSSERTNGRTNPRTGQESHTGPVKLLLPLPTYANSASIVVEQSLKVHPLHALLEEEYSNKCHCHIKNNRSLGVEQSLKVSSMVTKDMRASGIVGLYEYDNKLVVA